MRLLVIDPDGSSGLDLCLRAQAQGHHVKFAIRQNERNKLIGRGLVEVVPDPREWFKWSDLIVHCDNSVYLRDLDLHRESGGKAIAASQETALWEIDRQVGHTILRKAGIPTLPFKEFNNYDDAIAHVKKTDKRYVSKPTGGVEGDKSLSYVSSTPEDMVFMLERWKRLNKLKTPFILQDFVSGVEMGTAGWFGPGGWNEGWEENFEHKKMMNDDMGPSTGEQGTIMRYVRHSKLARKMLEPLTDILEKADYVGDIDVNCIVDDKGQAWPLEFTCRLGWPAFYLQTALCNGDVAEWLMDLATGKDARCLSLDRVACGIVLSIPDYPNSKFTRKEVAGIPVYGLTESLWKHWHPCEMMLGESVPNRISNQHIKTPIPVTAGDYVGVMTSTSTTVKDAALTTYRRLQKLVIPNSPQYRTDIGKRLAKQLPKIQKHGYAMGMTYSHEN